MSDRLARLRRVVLLLFFTASLTLVGITTPSVRGSERHETNRLLDPSPATGAHLGYSVAIHGDIIVVGAPFDPAGGHARGLVIVYRRGPEGWIEEQRLESPTPQDQASFGFSVAAAEDLVVIGSPWYGDQRMTGAAFVFRYEDTSWVHDATLTPPESREFDTGGYAVAAFENRIAITAPAWEDRGAVFLYERSNTTWSLEHVFRPGVEGLATFGVDVAMVEHRVAIGDSLAAPLGDGGDGAAWVYERNTDGAWGVPNRIDPVAPQAEFDRFAMSVAFANDDLLVGRYDAPGEYEPGIVQVYRRNESGWEFTEMIRASDGSNRDFFGYCVAASGNLAAIGAGGQGPRHSEGAVYLFASNGRNWIEIEKLTASDGARGDDLGIAVALDGNTPVAGIPGRESNRGGAYVFDVPSCTAGAVGAANGIAQDVLSVNGSFGDERRSIRVEVGAPVDIAVEPPGDGPDPARFVLYAWQGRPDETGISPHPYYLGATCMPTFVTVGSPKPFLIWNNLGRAALLGPPTRASHPAPWSWASRAPRASGSFTLQGFIEDDRSWADAPISITNAVVVTIER